MMQFLRKHQKIFFLFITVIIVVSFTFFGTYSTFSNREYRPKDEKVAKAVDGSDIMKSEIDLLSMFLSSENNGALSRKHIPNFLNDGVISKDFISTGMASLLMQKHFDVLAPQLQNSLEKAQKCSFYVHPQVPFISAKEVWKRYVQGFEEKYNAIQSQQTFSCDLIDTFLGLYKSQLQLPSDMLKKFLIFQQRQYSGIPADPNLLYEDTSLFGFHTIEDWFGQNFIDLISQFVINASVLAKKKGYVVTSDEAFGDLLKNAKNYCDKNKAQQKEIPLHSDRDYFAFQLQVLGVDQKKMVALWQKVLLFRKYFYDVGDSIFIDALQTEEFSAFSQEKAHIDLYQLPESLRLVSFNDLLRLQMYVKAVSPKISTSPKYLLEMADIYYPLEEIEKKYPQLVERSFEVEVAQVSLQELGLKITERELWDWQLDESNWQALRKEFVELASANLKLREERFSFLEKLPKPIRYNVDNFSRATMVKNQPEHIFDALKDSPMKKMSLSVRKQHDKFPLSGIYHFEDFAKALEEAPINEEIEKLSHYSDDGKTYYRIKVLSKDDNKKILTFSQVLNDGTIDVILERFLSDEYQKRKGQFPEKFKDAKGEWKSFAAIKEEIGAIVFADVLQAIDNNLRQEAKNDTFSWKEGQGPLDFYAKHRLHYHMKEGKKALNQDPLSTLWVNQDNSTLLTDQWKLQLHKKEVTRASDDMWLRKETFLYPVSSWSSLYTKERGEIIFFYVRDVEKSDSLPIVSGHKTKEVLSAEAKCNLTEKLLTELKDVMVLPIREQQP